MGALAEVWAQVGRSAMQAQDKAGQMMAEAMKAMPEVGGDAPAASRALGAEAATPDYEELALLGGRAGVFAGGRSQRLFAPAVAASLQRHDAAEQVADHPAA